MTELGNATSCKRGAAAASAMGTRQLVRVGGIVYTIPELVGLTGMSASDVRRRAGQLLRRGRPFTLADFGQVAAPGQERPGKGDPADLTTGRGERC